MAGRPQRRETAMMGNRDDREIATTRGPEKGQYIRQLTIYTFYTKKTRFSIIEIYPLFYLLPFAHLHICTSENPFPQQFSAYRALQAFLLIAVALFEL